MILVGISFVLGCVLLAITKALKFLWRELLVPLLRWWMPNKHWQTKYDFDQDWQPDVFMRDEALDEHFTIPVADLHIQPVLKETFLGRDISIDNPRHTNLEGSLENAVKGDFFTVIAYLIDNLTRLDPFGRDPLVVRTDLPKLRRGGVRLAFSAAMAPEREFLEDVQIRLRVPGLNLVLFKARFNLLKLVMRVLWLILPLAMFVFWRAVETPAPPEKVLGIDKQWLLGLPLWLKWFVVIAITEFGVTATVLWSVYYKPSYLNNSYFASVLNMYRKVERKIKRYNDKRRGYKPVSEKRASQAHEVVHAKWPEQFRQHLVEHELNGKILKSIDPDVTIYVHSIEGSNNLEGKETYRIIRKHMTRLKNQPAMKLPRINLDRMMANFPGDHKTIRNEVMANVDALIDAGTAIFGLGHYYVSVIVSSAFPYPDSFLESIRPERMNFVWKDPTAGLTQLGREVVARIFQRGAFVCLRHVSPQGRADIYCVAEEMPDISRGRVIATHTGLGGIFNHPYNLDDWEVDWICQNDGLIGIHYTTFVLSGNDPAKLGVGYIEKSIDHILQRGIVNGMYEEFSRCIALGSDLDGFSNPADELATIDLIPRLTQYLISKKNGPAQVGEICGENRKYDPEMVYRIMGGNVVEHFDKYWTAAPLP